MSRRLLDNESRPLYVPSTDKPPIVVALDTEPETTAIDQLRSFKVDEAELLTPAQADPNLRLAALFEGDAVVLGDAIVRKACELFGLPEDQIKRTETLVNRFALTETLGFKRPASISFPKERSLDK